MHERISQIDLWVILVYLMGITAVGLYASRRVRDSSSFFIGGRRFGKWLTLGQSLSGGTHADQATGVMGACYDIGLAGIWYQWMWLFTTPLYWLTAPVFRRLRLVTTADFFELRYGRSLAVMYSIFAMYLTIISVSMIIKASATTVEAITGFPETTIMTVVSGVFLTFAFAGGLVAAATTDFVQSIFITFLSFAAVPFGVHALGGITKLAARLPPHMADLANPAEMNWFTVCTLIIVGAIGSVAQPGTMTQSASANTEMNARIGNTYGNFVKRLCTLGWALTGLLGAALYPGLTPAHREEILGVLTLQLFPKGFAGLMIAAILASVMSSCSGLVVSGAALAARNLYRPGRRTDTDSAELKRGRIATLAITIGALGLAILLPSVVAGMIQFVTATPFLGVPIWVGVLWGRANRYGAWVSAIGSALLYYGCGLIGLHFSVCSLVSLTFGISSLVAVSLITPPEPSARLEQLFIRLHTPVGKDPPQVVCA